MIVEVHGLKYNVPDDAVADARAFLADGVADREVAELLAECGYTRQRAHAIVEAAKQEAA
jgi:hypothetical protein